MTGPEHYAEAERIITSTYQDSIGGLIVDVHATDSEVARAQVHATLAQAAATLDVQLNEHLLAEWAGVLS